MLSKKLILIVLPELGTSTSTRAKGLVMSLIKNWATTDKATSEANSKSGKLLLITVRHSSNVTALLGTGQVAILFLGGSFTTWSAFFLRLNFSALSMLFHV